MFKKHVRPNLGRFGRPRGPKMEAKSDPRGAKKRHQNDTTFLIHMWTELGPIWETQGGVNSLVARIARGQALLSNIDKEHEIHLDTFRPFGWRKLEMRRAHSARPKITRNIRLFACAKSFQDREERQHENTKNRIEARQHQERRKV